MGFLDRFRKKKKEEPAKEEPQPPGETQSPDPTTPVLESADLGSQSEYTLSWSLPPSSLGTPDGGYDIFIDGVDTNQEHRTTSLQTQINNLDTSVPHCFNSQARWTQTGVTLVSNEICVPPSSTTPPPEEPPMPTEPNLYCNDMTIDELIASGLYDTITDNRQAAGPQDTNGNYKNNLYLASPFGDIYNGRSGDDCIIGNIGNDDLKGARGNDIIYGEDGDDILIGNRGDDYLNGGAGSDNLEGGVDVDTCNTDESDITKSCEIEDVISFGFGGALHEIISPLKQMMAGVAPEDVQCRFGMELIQKPTGSVACVKPSSISNLLDIGWIEIS